MLGANGAGKTTLLRAISGSLGRVKGSITFDGEELVGKAPEKIAALGVCQVPEGRGTFTELTVGENLEVGAWRRKDKPAIKADKAPHARAVPDPRPASQPARRRAVGRRAADARRRPGADGQRRGCSCSTSRRSGSPRSSSSSSTQTLGDVVRELGVTTMVVEQNAQLALQLAERAYLLEVGEIVREGSAAELRADDQIKRAYLGV